VAEAYDALGAEKVEAMFADPHTHTSRLGAELNASIVATAVRELPKVRLKEFLSSGDGDREATAALRSAAAKR